MRVWIYHGGRHKFARKCPFKQKPSTRAMQPDYYRYQVDFLFLWKSTITGRGKGEADGCTFTPLSGETSSMLYPQLCGFWPDVSKIERTTDRSPRLSHQYRYSRFSPSLFHATLIARRWKMHQRIFSPRIDDSHSASRHRRNVDARKKIRADVDK